jgi:putative endonuclease
MQSKMYFVYILASKRNGTIYTGVTNDLIRRVYQHKNGINEGFTKKYSVHDLVYFEATDDVQAALRREKQIKKWNRQWKIDLIEKQNPEWRDLYPGLISEGVDSRLRGNDNVTWCPFDSEEADVVTC